MQACKGVMMVALAREMGDGIDRDHLVPVQCIGGNGGGRRHLQVGAGRARADEHV